MTFIPWDYFHDPVYHKLVEQTRHMMVTYHYGASRARVTLAERWRLAMAEPLYSETDPRRLSGYDPENLRFDP